MKGFSAPSVDYSKSFKENLERSEKERMKKLGLHHDLDDVMEEGE